MVMAENTLVLRKVRFANSKTGCDEMLERVRGEASKAGSGGVIFAVEAGSHYWRNLACFLDGEGVPFRLISPYTLKRSREGEDINRRKNDFRDGEMAAALLRTGKCTESKLLYGNYAEIRATFATYRRLRKESTMYANVLKGLLDGVFPEFTEAFKDPRGKTAMAVLSTSAQPQVIAETPVSEFIETVRASFTGRGFQLKKIYRLNVIASSSIGITQGAKAVSDEIALLVGRIKLNSEQIEKVVKKIALLVDAVPESRHMLSVPGLGYLSVAGIIAGLGPISQYRNGRQLVKMAGTNPTQRESAGKSSRRTPMSKHGRADLRWCLWPAVVSLLRCNPDFRAWAKNKQDCQAHAHPLHRREVIGAGINRLLRLVFALVSKQIFYRLPEDQIALAA